LVDKMCDSCPFRADGGAPKINVPPEDMKEFRRVAEVSEFYCHETVLKDPLTKKDAEGNADPACGVQPHFKVCRGAWEHKRDYVTARLAKRGLVKLEKRKGL